MDYSFWALTILIYIVGTGTGLHFGFKMGFRKACEDIITEAKISLLEAKIKESLGGGDNGV